MRLNFVDVNGDGPKGLTPNLFGSLPPFAIVTVDIDEVQSQRFYRLPIGRPVSATIMDVMFTGYVIERTVSGGDLTTYSIKIQPDRFYKYGEEVTDKWI